jgi:hypothetical protein
MDEGSINRPKARFESAKEVRLNPSKIGTNLSERSKEVINL